MNVLDALFFTAVLGLAGIFVYGLYVMEVYKSLNRKNEDATNDKH
jgi:hypothetical protein